MTMKRPLLSTLATATLATLAVSQHADQLMYTVVGDAGLDNYGAAMAFCGDVNADGHTDFVVGARFDDNNGSNSGMARVISGVDGSTLYSFDGDASGDQLGYSVSGAGDVNNDGHDDVIAGAPISTGRTGYARVFSGKDGTVLYTFNGLTAGAEFGWSVGDAGDVNLDGFDDVIVGAPRGGAAGSGMFQVLSGANGSVLYTKEGTGTAERLGSSVAGAGDVNLDAFPDFVVGASNGNGGTGQALVYSGLTGTVLWTFNGNAAADNFGVWVDTAGDVNGDGHADLVVGANGSDANGTNSGLARVFSGKDGTTVHSFTGGPGQAAGWTVSEAGDIDKDGFGDIIVGNGASPSPGITWVYSGRTGSLIYTVQGYQSSGGGDLNGDGTDDFISGTWLLNGVVWAYSGAELQMQSDRHLIDGVTGGTQRLSIDFGASQANRLYWIFGSITGVSPGVNVNGVQIPLNPDVYTDLAIANVSAPIFMSFRGTLSSVGTATAALNVPRNLPSVGFSLFHAAVVYDANGAFYAASNPVPVHVR